jgi:hypothetical protein
LAPEPIPEDFPASGNEARDLRERFNIMHMAIELMAASAGLGQAIARIKGEMRQSITVDRYEHGPAGARHTQNLSTQMPRQRRDSAGALHAQGEGECWKVKNNHRSKPLRCKVKLPRPPNRGGAPSGNRNALKTGRHTARLLGLSKMVRAQLASARAAIAIEKSDTRWPK